MILANKQDLEGAIGYQTLRTELALTGLEKNEIKIQETSALLDKGLQDGFVWLVNKLAEDEEKE